MNTKMEKLEKNVIKFEITVGADKFSEALKKSFAKNSKKFNIPGFRKGKAPMNIIKKYYGEGAFYEDAINFCCEDTYPKAVAEYGIKPVDYPHIDIVDIGEGKDLTYTATVTVSPEVELGEYKGVEVKKVQYDVTDEDVNSQLVSMQEKNGRVETKAEGSTVENGNIAIIDFKGYVDGVAFEGGEGKDYSLEIGSGSFIDTFEEQLVGLKVGESKNVNVTFPAEYGKAELDGKPAVFEVTIKEIKFKELPALDDEFAKDVSEFDTLEELKADIKAKMVTANEQKAKREYEDAVVFAVCENAKIDIPQVMVDKEIDIMLRDLEERLKYQGLDLNSYYEYTNNTEEKVREYMKENAEKRVKTDLVIGKIAEVEQINVADEEILTKAAEVAKLYGQQDVEKTAQLIFNNQREYLRMDIVNEKVIKILVDNSKAIA